MSELKAAVQGDVGDERTITLAGIDNLDSVSAVVAHVYTGNKTETTHVATLDAAVASSSDCTITVQLGDATGWLATADPGNYRIEYQLTFANGDILTWPAVDGDRIRVRAQGDAA